MSIRGVMLPLAVAGGAAALTAVLIGSGLNVHSGATACAIFFNIVPFSVLDWVSGTPYHREPWLLVACSAFFWGSVGAVIMAIKIRRAGSSHV